MRDSVDYLIVGAGLSGLTVAERLCAAGKRCLVVESREHIGGNVYDCLDEHGVLIHKYGPHYFRTNSPKIFNYLSGFTDWIPMAYTIHAHANGRLWNFPINLNTFEQFTGRKSQAPEDMQAWLDSRRERLVGPPANSEEVITSQVGRELYEMFFEGYTTKQWGRHPKELDASVCGRIPIRTDRDNRYLREEIQALPSEGYTRMCERMIAACGNLLEVRLNTDYRSVLGTVSHGTMVYTGPIDAFFDKCLGRLPYRSLRFERQHFTGKELAATGTLHGRSGLWQRTVQVNYPNDHEFTRIVEVKHITGQQCDGSTIVREYPEEWIEGRERYYPVPTPETAALYREYCNLAETSAPGVVFLGRLAKYRYYNMDQVVGAALETSRKLLDAPLR